MGIFLWIHGKWWGNGFHVAGERDVRDFPEVEAMAACSWHVCFFDLSL